jgi:flagellar biosynthesis protein FlhB
MQVVELIKQMAYVIPSIMVGTQAITAAIHGAFNIQNNNVKHIISWVLAVVAAIVTCALGGLTFGLGGWDYALAAATGLLAGGASNGVYDWPTISNIIDKFYDLFHKKQ